MSRLTGQIVRLVLEKGYCFIAPSNGDRDVFAHVRDFTPGGLVWDEQLEGRRVSFTTMSSERGTRAADVMAAD